jgi:hypothetical protein
MTYKEPSTLDYIAIFERWFNSAANEVIHHLKIIRIVGTEIYDYLLSRGA